MDRPKGRTCRHRRFLRDKLAPQLELRQPKAMILNGVQRRQEHKGRQ